MHKDVNPRPAIPPPDGRDRDPEPVGGEPVTLWQLAHDPEYTTRPHTAPPLYGPGARHLLLTGLAPGIDAADADAVASDLVFRTFGADMVGGRVTIDELRARHDVRDDRHPLAWVVYRHCSHVTTTRFRATEEDVLEALVCFEHRDGRHTMVWLAIDAIRPPRGSAALRPGIRLSQ